MTTKELLDMANTPNSPIVGTLLLEVLRKVRLAKDQAYKRQAGEAIYRLTQVEQEIDSMRERGKNR